MANDLTTTTGRAISTPEGASALRRISCSAAWTEDDPVEASRWLTPELAKMLPLAIAEASSALAPSLGSDFRRLVSPTLALVAPAGMSKEDASAWLATAAETLSGIPADLLERGCAAARRRADHPSKIIATIFAEIGGVWDARKREAGRLRELQRIADDRPALPPPEAVITPDELEVIKQEFGITTDPYGEATARKPIGPLHMPTAADYVGLGMTPEAATDAVAENERLVAAQAEEAKLRASERADRRHLVGWGLIATALAHRHCARREGQPTEAGAALMVKLLLKHGKPPLAWLIGATRLELARLRARVEAA